MNELQFKKVLDKLKIERGVLFFINKPEIISEDERLPIVEIECTNNVFSIMEKAKEEIQKGEDITIEFLKNPKTKETTSLTSNEIKDFLNKYIEVNKDLWIKDGRGKDNVYIMIDNDEAFLMKEEAKTEFFINDFIFHSDDYPSGALVPIEIKRPVIQKFLGKIDEWKTAAKIKDLIDEGVEIR